MLQGRLGRTTIVELRDGRRLRVINVAWGYDTGDTHAHVTSNVSPGIEGEAVDVFNTADVRRVLAESGEVLYRRG